MADQKISQLTGATTPLAGTEVLPIVQSGTTKKVSVDNLTAGKTVNAANLVLSGDAAIGTVVTTGLKLSIRGATTSTVIGCDNGVNTGFVVKFASNLTNIGNDFSQPLGFLVNNLQQAKLEASGDFTLNTGNFVQGTAAKGVNFTANTPAAGMTSQLLNWYEEGTFTPTVVGSSTAGTTSYSAQSGWYTRVGNQVTVQIVFTVTNMTGTGNLLVGGLPFTVKSGTQGVGAVMTSSMDWASGTSITFYIPGGGTTASFYSSGDNIAWAAVPVKTAWEAVITATYFV